MNLKSVHISGYALLVLISIGNVTSTSRSSVKSDALDAVLADANATITANYLSMTSLVASHATNDNITEAVTYINDLTTSANSTVQQLGVTMNQKILDTEALGPSYYQCTAGQREKAESIVNEGSRNLLGCQYPINRLQSDYDTAMLEYSQEVESIKNNANLEIENCVTNQEPTDEELVVIEACVDTQVQILESAYKDLEASLLRYVDEANSQAAMLKYEAVRCVDTAVHHAGDQTGYFLWLMDECVKQVTEISTSSSTPLRV